MKYFLGVWEYQSIGGLNNEFLLRGIFVGGYEYHRGARVYISISWPLMRTNTGWNKDAAVELKVKRIL